MTDGTGVSSATPDRPFPRVPSPRGVFPDLRLDRGSPLVLPSAILVTTGAFPDLRLERGSPLVLPSTILVTTGVFPDLRLERGSPLVLPSAIPVTTGRFRTPRLERGVLGLFRANPRVFSSEIGGRPSEPGGVSRRRVASPHYA